jgi:ligand-binding sensor domain-containing protein
MKYRIELLLLLFSFIGNTFGQTLLPQFIKYDESDGLKSSNYIGDIKADSEGFLWIVNFNGVSRYDGESFTEIQAGKTHHNALLRFFETYNGEKGVIDYFGQVFMINNDSLKPYRNNAILKSLKPKGGYTDLFIDSLNSLHISYNNIGYVVIDSIGGIVYPLNNLSSKINGEVIILKEDGSTFITFTSKSKRKAEQIFVLNEKLEILDSILIDKKQFNYPTSKTCWSDGVFYYSNGFGNFYQINKKGQIKEIEFKHPIINLYKDSYGDLWISSFEQGVYKLKNDSINYDQNYFPNTTSILSEEDIEGGFWVYSHEDGLVQIPYPNFLFYNKYYNPKLYDNINSLCVSEKQVLMAHSSNSILSIDLKTGKIDSIQILNPEENIIESMYVDSKSDNLWYSQRGAIFYRKNNEWSRFLINKLPEFNNRSKIKFLGYDPFTDCNIAAYDNRYFLFRGTAVKYVSPRFKDKIFTLLKQGHRTYVSTYSGVFKQEGETVQHMEKFFPELKDRAHSIIEFDKQVIISIKKGGLYSLKEDSLRIIKYKNIPLENALVIKTNSDSLWCFASQGSFLIKKGGEIDGFERPQEIISPSIKGNKYGVYWSTWNKGVFYTSYKAIMKNRLNPVKLVLNSIRINGEEQKINQNNFNIAYNKSFVQIDYQAISYKDWPITYRYKMNGLNSKWISLTETNIQFTTLPTGEYKFELQAKKGSQLWSDPIQIEFVVFPPIWRRWWFIVVSIILLAVFVYYIISFRFKTIKREKDLVIDKLKAEQRALRAQMDPHFVFNVVASAQYLVLKEENEKAIEFLNMFSKLMRSILDHSNNNQISLEREIKFLEEYIQLEHFRLEESFDFEFKTKSINQLLQNVIPPFIIQPFIENAIHHGLKNKEGNKTLLIEFKSEKGYLVIQITDNGIGRTNAGKFISEEKRKRKSHGIRIIKERLELHNNRKQENVTYVDLDKGGTVAIVKIKLD